MNITHYKHLKTLILPIGWTVFGTALLWSQSTPDPYERTGREKYDRAGRDKVYLQEKTTDSSQSAKQKSSANVTGSNDTARITESNKKAERKTAETSPSASPYEKVGHNKIDKDGSAKTGDKKYEATPKPSPSQSPAKKMN